MSRRRYLTNLWGRNTGEIDTRDRALRAFFSLYFLLTAFQWWLDAPLARGIPVLGELLSFLSDDLSGKRAGADLSYLAFHWSALRLAPWCHSLLVITAVGCVLVLRRNTKSYGTAVLLAVGQLLAYSAGRRCIPFDMVYFALLGYGAGLALSRLPRFGERAERSRMPWLMAVSVFYTLYLISFAAKMAAVGPAWANTWHLGELLHYGKFRFDVGASPIRCPEFVVRYFSEPRLLGAVALAAVLAAEAAGGAAFLLGDGMPVYSALMIPVHLLMYASVGILFRSVLGLHILLALTGLPRGEPRLRRRSTLAVLGGVNAAVIVLCWTLPTSPLRNATALVWPFGRFNMYAGEERALTVYYLRNPAGELADPAVVREELRASIGSLNSHLLG